MMLLLLLLLDLRFPVLPCAANLYFHCSKVLQRDQPDDEEGGNIHSPGLVLSMYGR